MTDICPCGVYIKLNPHLSDICAPTLPERLRNMASWIDKQPTYKTKVGFQFKESFSLSYGSMIEPRVTAFAEALPPDSHGCVYCGRIFYLQTYGFNVVYADNFKIKVGKYDASLCNTCFNEHRRLCPVSMEQIEVCIKRDKTFLQVVFLCFRRSGLCLDLRRLLYKYIRWICVCCY